MKLKGFTILIALFVLIVNGCRNAPIIPESPVISFGADIQPILAGNCQMSSCHASSQNGGEARARPLDTYTDVMSNGGIVPYQAHSSSLYERVINESGNIMPPAPAQPLSQQQLLNIYLWIMQGANNN